MIHTPTTSLEGERVEATFAHVASTTSPKKQHNAREDVAPSSLTFSRGD